MAIYTLICISHIISLPGFFFFFLGGGGAFLVSENDVICTVTLLSASYFNFTSFSLFWLVMVRYNVRNVRKELFPCLKKNIVPGEITILILLKHYFN